MNALVDSWGRIHNYLRISVTDRCNLRCVYCMPPQGITHSDREHVLRFDEITRLARLFVRMGVNKIRLTGGEPLVRRNVERLIGDLASIKGVETLAMTTNGVLLREYAESLRAAGLSHLNISLDTLKPERFVQITLRDMFDRVQAGIDAALKAGFTPLKLNVVVVGGKNDDELDDFVELARGDPIHVRFIEYMPFKSNGWRDARLVTGAAMRSIIERRYTLKPVLTDQQASRTAREFRIDGFCGTIGLISPMSDHFCAGCNRLRLTADGTVKPCLFIPAEVSLRDALRAGNSDAELMCLIRRAVAAKPEKHPPMERLLNTENRSMSEIGG